MTPDNAPHTKRGRGAGLANDPLNEFAALGADVQRKVGLVADLLAPEFAGMTVAALENLRDGYRATLEELGPEWPAHSYATGAVTDAPENGWRLADEAVKVAQGLARVGPIEDQYLQELEVEKAENRRHAAEAEMFQAYEAAEGAEGADRSPDLIEDYGKILASLISVERELQIAEQGNEVARVSAEEAALLAGRTVAKTGWAERPGRPRPTIAVTRDDVAHPPLLDRAYDALPEQRQEDLERLMSPLAEWVADQPDAFIEARHAELGPAPEPGFDPGVARKANLLDHMEEIQANALYTARENIEYFAEHEPERVPAEERAAEHAEAMLASFDDKRAAMIAGGGYPADVLAIEEDGGVERQVYEREAQIRQRMDIEHGVRTTIEQPSPGLLDELGPVPEQGTPEHDAWVDAVRQVQTRRLESAATRAAGVDPPEPDPAVDQLIADYRTDAGKAANLAAAHAIEPKSFDLGF